MSERERENSKTLFYKDCTLGSLRKRGGGGGGGRQQELHVCHRLGECKTYTCV